MSYPINDDLSLLPMWSEPWLR